MSNQASLGDISGSGTSDSDQKKESRKDLETKEESFFWKNVPEEWSLVDGTKIFEVNPSYDAEGEITYIGMDNLQTELPYPSIEGIRDAEDYSGKLFTEDDVIFPRITPCTENGKRAIIEDIDTEYGIGSTEFIVLSPDKDKLLPWYLFYLVNSYVVRDYAISRMRGSTGRQRVPYSVFRNELDVALPPKDEQRRIASVLYNVDQAISKTEEIIEQTQRVKKGLMQDLFTEGYYSHEEFQDTRLGKVPANWDMIPAKDLCEEITVGIVSGATDHYCGEEGVPFVRNQDITPTGIEAEEPKFISEEFHEQNKKSELKEGDVVTVRTGQPGTSCVVGKEYEGANSFSTIISRLRESTNEKFYSKFVNSDKALQFIDSWKAGGVQDNFNIGVMRKLPVPYPPEDEQEKIVESVEAVQEKIQNHKEEKGQLQRLKKGLMQDLLTGRVRTGKEVEVLDEVLNVEANQGDS